MRRRSRRSRWPRRLRRAFAAASPDFRFAFAVAAFADVMRGGETWSLDDIRAVAAATAGAIKDREELVSLIDKARALRGQQKTIATDTAATIAQ